MKRINTCGGYTMQILVSGLLNTETTTAVLGFPVAYYPIDYAFFGVNTAVSGVAFNLAKALTILGDTVRLNAMIGSDFAAGYICDCPGRLFTETPTPVTSSVLQTAGASSTLSWPSGTCGSTIPATRPPRCCRRPSVRIMTAGWKSTGM